MPTKKPTNAMLTAALEARQAEIDALKLSLATTERDLREARIEVGNLESMLKLYRTGELRADVQRIRTNAEAMIVARELAQQGIACYARGLKVYNSRTHEAIAG